MKTPLFCPVCDERVSDGTPTTDPPDALNSPTAEDADEALVICPHCGSAIECGEPECSSVGHSADGHTNATNALSPIEPFPAHEEGMQPTEPEPHAGEDEEFHHAHPDAAIDVEAIDADGNEPPMDDIGDEGMQLELDAEADALHESSQQASEDDYDAESDLETVRENFEDTDIEPPSATRRYEELDAVAGLDWDSVPVASRPRPLERSWLMKILPPVLGGLTAIPIAMAILWYGFGKDIGGAGPQVARFAPWIVPKHLRGRPYYDTDTSSPVRRNTLTRPSDGKPFSWPTPTDANGGEDSTRDPDADIAKKPTPMPDVFPDSTNEPQTPTESPAFPEGDEPPKEQPPKSDASESTEPVVVPGPGDANRDD
jgi:hypothetical protein